jgi:hypothetical protein
MLKSIKIGLVLTMFLAMVTLVHASPDVGMTASKTTVSIKKAAAVDLLFLHVPIVRIDRPEGYIFVIQNSGKPDNTIINGILNARYRYSLRQNSVTS